MFSPLKTVHYNIRFILEEGSARGVFLPNDELHKQTFYWIWPPFIQGRLDIFRDYWNNHRIQKSSKKVNGLGSSQEHAP
ncbi:hypothetical protein B0H11DRAFT_2250069 [Mycena galericulata]|nr:hypothetical protein B0H11DRAFT_2250069 [Mycena galericulata]